MTTTSEKYVYYDEKTGKYKVLRNIRRKLSVYKSGFDTFEEAVLYKRLLEENGWVLPNKPSYINYNKNSGRYTVIKRVDGKNIYFGSFDDLNEALECRKYYMDNGWVKDNKYCKTYNRRNVSKQANKLLQMRNKIEQGGIFYVK